MIDGKKLARSIEAEIAQNIAQLKKETGIVPGLAAVLVGDHEASKIYVRNKEAACQKVGMYAEQHRLPAETTMDALLRFIGELNRNPHIHGILIQLPLPSSIDTEKVLQAVAPEKDIDGFHPINMGNLLIGHPTFVPCTPLGIMRILESIGCSPEGKEAVVLGRSNIVGKPAALLLMQRHATVTICHSKTPNLPEKVRRADLVVAAIGRAQAVKGDWIKKGAVVIDVGINRLSDGRLTGDVDFEEARKNASFITPVPGGVGPMTIAMLLSNTLQAAQKFAGGPLA